MKPIQQLAQNVTSSQTQAGWKEIVRKPEAKKVFQLPARYKKIIGLDTRPGRFPEPNNTARG